MARRMHVSRIQLDRLLNPENDTLPQETVQRAESAIGHSVFDAIPNREITGKEQETFFRQDFPVPQRPVLPKRIFCKSRLCRWWRNHWAMVTPKPKSTDPAANLSAYE
jgi:hypothetical protein